MQRRKFEVWEYTVSHAQLLLRSVRNEQHATRVDVLFKNVGFVMLPTSLTITAIEPVSAADPLVERAKAEEVLRDGQTAFALRSDEQDGLVVSGSMVSAEDDREYHEPSSLPCWPMRSGE